MSVPLACGTDWHRWTTIGATWQKLKQTGDINSSKNADSRRADSSKVTVPKNNNKTSLFSVSETYSPADQRPRRRNHRQDRLQRKVARGPASDRQVKRDVASQCLSLKTGTGGKGAAAAPCLTLLTGTRLTAFCALNML